jgi:membrane-bound ClpP family serine protease
MEWLNFIEYPLGGFVVIFIGALLLFAEVLVRGKFIFAIVGLASISMYFGFFAVQEGLALWMGAGFIVGVLLIVMDGKFIGDGTIGGIGLLIMLVSLAIPSPSILYGISVVTAFVLGAIGSVIFPKYFPRRELWSKLTLQDTLSSEKGYNSMNEGYKELVGVEGVAETDFRPSGTFSIDGKKYSAISEGSWIKKGEKIRVHHVSGTRIVVKIVNDPNE